LGLQLVEPGEIVPIDFAELVSPVESPHTVRVVW
jgi:hypothetical protein